MAMPQARDIKGDMSEEAKLDPWDLRIFDDVYMDSMPKYFRAGSLSQEYKKMTDQEKDERIMTFSTHIEYTRLRVLMHKTLLRVRDFLADVGEADYHNLLGKRFHYELDKNLAAAFLRITALNGHFVYQTLERFLNDYQMWSSEREKLIYACDNMKKNVESVQNEFEDRKKQMKLSDAKQRNAYLRDMQNLRNQMRTGVEVGVDGADKVSVYIYDGLEGLDPEIGELVTRLVTEKIEQERQNLGKFEGGGGRSPANPMADDDDDEKPADEMGMLKFKLAEAQEKMRKFNHEIQELKSELEKEQKHRKNIQDELGGINESASLAELSNKEKEEELQELRRLLQEKTDELDAAMDMLNNPDNMANPVGAASVVEKDIEIAELKEEVIEVKRRFTEFQEEVEEERQEWHKERQTIKEDLRKSLAAGSSANTKGGCL